MGRRAKDIVRDEFRRAAARVFAGHSMRTTPVEPIQAEHAAKLFHTLGEEREMLSSFIRLEGGRLSSCVALMANAETVGSLLTSQFSHPRDYVGELSNLVMGGLKNGLCAYGVRPQLGLPVSVQGLRLELVLHLQTQEAVVALLDSGPVVAVLQYTVADEFWEGQKGSRAAEAGSINLF